MCFSNRLDDIGKKDLGVIFYIVIGKKDLIFDNPWNTAHLFPDFTFNITKPCHLLDRFSGIIDFSVQ